MIRRIQHLFFLCFCCYSCAIAQSTESSGQSGIGNRFRSLEELISKYPANVYLDTLERLVQQAKAFGKTDPAYFAAHQLYFLSLDTFDVVNSREKLIHQFYARQIAEGYKLLEALQPEDFFEKGATWLELFRALKWDNRPALKSLDSAVRSMLKNHGAATGYMSWARKSQDAGPPRQAFYAALLQLEMTDRPFMKDDPSGFFKWLDIKEMAASAGLSLVNHATRSDANEEKEVNEQVLDYSSIESLVPATDYISFSLQKQITEPAILQNPVYRRQLFHHLVAAKKLEADLFAANNNPGYAITLYLQLLAHFDYPATLGAGTMQKDSTMKAFFTLYPERLETSDRYKILRSLGRSYFQTGNYALALSQWAKADAAFQKEPLFEPAEQKQEVFRRYISSIRIAHATRNLDSASRYIHYLESSFDRDFAGSYSSNSAKRNNGCLVRLLDIENAILRHDKKKASEGLSTFFIEALAGSYYEAEDFYVDRSFFKILYDRFVWEEKGEIAFVPADVITRPSAEKLNLLDEHHLAADLLLQRSYYEALHYGALHQVNDYRFSSAVNSLIESLEMSVMSNFIYLSVNERINYYEQRLAPTMHLLHTFLFHNDLQEAEAGRVKHITLFLKRSLMDQSMIGSEFLQPEPGDQTGDIISSARGRLEKIRLIRNLKSVSELFINNNILYPDNMMSIVVPLLEADSRAAFQSAFDKKLFLEKIWEYHPDSVRKRLKRNEKLVEYVRYENAIANRVEYGVMVFGPESGLEFIKNIFTESELQHVLHDNRTSAQTAWVAQSTRGIKVPEKDMAIRTDSLYQYIISPVDSLLTHTETLYFIPDGLLNRISFYALKKDSFLFERFHLRQLSHNLELNAADSAEENNSILLAGGIDYDKSSELNPDALSFPPNERRFENLPGTKEEISQLSELAKSYKKQITLFTGDHVPDSLAQNLGGYGVIHLATHGFYHPQDQNKLSYLLRCGIAVSGANHTPGQFRHTVTSAYADGIIYGYEFLYSNLSGCDLVTLSACETALGDDEGNLGVMGLQHALKAAGARHILVSLWPVPDKETAEFMNSFYSRYFSGTDPFEALRATQLKMSKKYPVPVWAAFTLIK